MPPAGKNPKSDSVRLQVLLARCGLGSRRACEDYITTGRVTVDGEPVTALGAKVNIGTQKVAVDGEPIRPERPVCYMVNKPKGVLCTNSDPSGRPRVVDLFPASAGRLFPVGRLDENSVGLLLVTNDGDLSHQLAHPRFKVPKVYEVQVAGRPSREIMQQLRQGMYFSDGRFKVDNAKITGSRGKSTLLEVTLSEGRNREIRRLFSRVGHKVMKLERVAFGPLRLRAVAVGKYRALSREEMKLLREYIENGERRTTPTDTSTSPGRKNASRKPAKSSQKPGKGSQQRVVEIGPISTSSGRDLAGRKRTGKQPVKKRSGHRANTDDDDEDSTDRSVHPAVVNRRPAGTDSKSSEAKPRTRKGSPRKPRQTDSANSRKADNLTDQAKVDSPARSKGGKAGRKPISNKRKAKAKQASRKRKRR